MGHVKECFRHLRRILIAKQIIFTNTRRLKLMFTLMKSTRFGNSTELFSFILYFRRILNVLERYVFLIDYMWLIVSVKSHFISYSSSRTSGFQTNSNLLSNIICSSWTLLITRSVEDHAVLVAPVLTGIFNVDTTCCVSCILFSGCMQGDLGWVWSVDLLLA